MNKIKELKELLAQFDDNEDVMIRIRPAMSDLDIGTITAKKVTYIEITYHVQMPRKAHEPRNRR